MVIHEYKGFHICRVNSNLYEVYEESNVLKYSEVSWFLMFKAHSLDEAKTMVDNYLDKRNVKWYQKIVDFFQCHTV